MYQLRDRILTTDLAINLSDTYHLHYVCTGRYCFFDPYHYMSNFFNVSLNIIIPHILYMYKVRNKLYIYIYSRMTHGTEDGNLDTIRLELEFSIINHQNPGYMNKTSGTPLWKPFCRRKVSTYTIICTIDQDLYY